MATGAGTAAGFSSVRSMSKSSPAAPSASEYVNSLTVTVRGGQRLALGVPQTIRNRVRAGFERDLGNEGVGARHLKERAGVEVRRAGAVGDPPRRVMRAGGRNRGDLEAREGLGRGGRDWRELRIGKGLVLDGQPDTRDLSGIGAGVIEGKEVPRPAHRFADELGERQPVRESRAPRYLGTRAEHRAGRIDPGHDGPGVRQCNAAVGKRQHRPGRDVHVAAAFAIKATAVPLGDGSTRRTSSGNVCRIVTST